MKSNPIPLIAVLLLWTYSLCAQDDLRYTIQLKSGSFIPPKNITTTNLNEFNRRAVRSDEKTFALIQFENIPSEAEKQHLKLAGIELLEYIPNNAYTVTITGELDNSILLQ